MSLVRWAIGLAACWMLANAAAQAQDRTRPSILFNRWQEDWSALADPAVPREPLDSLKYIPLSQSDPKTYLSFGVNVRERFESNNAPLFGIATANQNNNYLLSRSEQRAAPPPPESIIFSIVPCCCASGRGLELSLTGSGVLSGSRT